MIQALNKDLLSKQTPSQSNGMIRSVNIHRQRRWLLEFPRSGGV
jgi:hypothetical protein